MAADRREQVVDRLDLEPEPGLTAENGTRAFTLSEIMVRREWTSRGIAHALHGELLRGRHEKRATLLAEPENVNAYRAYLKVGLAEGRTVPPDWPDAPVLTRSYCHCPG